MANVGVSNRSLNRNKIKAGIIAGVIAGLAMGLVAFFSSAQTGQGFWTPLYLIGATAFGVTALVGGFGVALVGLGIHLIVSAIWGALFSSSLSAQTSTGTAFLRGLVYGVGVWLFMNYLVLPWSNPVMNDRVALAPGWFLVQHLVFGGVLSIAPALTKRFQSRMGQRELPPKGMGRAA